MTLCEKCARREEFEMAELTECRERSEKLTTKNQRMSMVTAVVTTLAGREGAQYAAETMGFIDSMSSIPAQSSNGWGIKGTNVGDLTYEEWNPSYESGFKGPKQQPQQKVKLTSDRVAEVERREVPPLTNRAFGYEVDWLPEKEYSVGAFLDSDFIDSYYFFVNGKSQEELIELVLEEDISIVEAEIDIEVDEEPIYIPEESGIILVPTGEIVPESSALLVYGIPFLGRKRKRNG